MKKMLSLLLASAMSLSLLAGCGGAPAPAQSNNPPAGGSSTSQGGSGTTDPTTPAGPIKVAALFVQSGYPSPLTARGIRDAPLHQSAMPGFLPRRSFMCPPHSPPTFRNTCNTCGRST